MDERMSFKDKKNIKHYRQDKAELTETAHKLLGEAESATDKSAKREKLKEYEKVLADLEAVNDALKIQEARMDIERGMSPISITGSIDPGERFTSFGEQLFAVARAQGPDRAFDPRLKYQAATGLSEGVSSDGGYLVQSDFSAELLNSVHETGMLMNKTRLTPISPMSNGLVIPAVDETSRVDGSRWGAVQAYWKDEAATASGSKPKFRQLNLKLKKLVGLAYATDELLADSTALGSVMQRAFAEEFGFKVDDAIINGDGVGKPLGMLNSNALVTVSKETGQLAGTVVSENIVNMFARMPASSLQTAEWYINQAIWPQLIQLNIIGGTASTPVFLPPGGLSSAPFGTLMGRPIVPIEQASALGTVGDIIFADLQQYQMIEKNGIQADTSIHVQFLTDEMAFRFIMRVDGQPIPNAALTPFKGTDTISPFVALATRA